jgi:glycosyltransferase involved in cell wall biosynthesis
MTHDYPPVTGGGLAVGVGELVSLLRSGHDVRVLTSRLADHAADDRRLLPPGTEGTTFARTGMIRAVCALRRADLVIVHFTHSFRRLALASIVLGPLLGKPTICVIHTAPDHRQYNRLRHLPAFAQAVIFALTGRALRGCAAVVALGPAHSAAVTATGFTVTHIAPLPYPMTAYREAGGHLGRSGPPASVIGFAGEISRLKGADLLPGLLCALTPRYRFVIAGRGSLASSVAACVAALPSAKRGCVELTGPVAPASMPRFYQDIGWLIVLSRSEAHCRVIVEAMLSGVIVLASRTCGSSDLIVDGVTGLLIWPDDPGSVAEALAALDADPERASAIRENAARFAVSLAASSRSSWCRLVGELLPRLGELLPRLGGLLPRLAADGGERVAAGTDQRQDLAQAVKRPVVAADIHGHPCAGHMQRLDVQRQVPGRNRRVAP